MSLAFFDLDKTLIADNSARLWLKEAWKMGEVSFFELVLGSYWLIKYSLGFTKLEDTIRYSAQNLKGKSSKTIQEITQDLFLSSIKNIYRPGALKALKEHKKKGQKTALLTSTVDLLSNLIKEDLEFDYCLSTKLEVDDSGFFTGQLLGLPCFGVHKITFAKNLSEHLGVSLKDCTFYTDSASDLPLLNLIGKPVVVNPDLHLWTRARLKRWPIVDWGIP